MSLRIGLVGAGVMGRNHARVIQELGGKLVAVADPDAKTSKLIAERYGAAAHADPAPLLKDPSIDALVVATPTVFHHEVAKAALEAGKHVLVEKPITPTPAQAEDLIRTAAKAGRVLAVGHVERHNPVVRWAKDALAKGALGDLVSLRSHRLSPFPERIRDVGVVLDIGIHDLDVVRYLAPGRPRSVYCLAGTHRKGVTVEDHASILVDFDSGVDAFSEVSWLTPTKVRSLVLTCANGVVELNYMTQEVAISRGRFGDIDPDNMFQVPVEYTVERMSLKKEEPLKNEHLDFWRAIKEGGKPLVGGRDGLAAVRMCEAALESAKTGARVTLKEAEA
jgi:UDP-N-acetylglucosamine 3-dehydrogenase